jgi:hypothetical protein
MGQYDEGAAGDYRGGLGPSGQACRSESVISRGAEGGRGRRGGGGEGKGGGRVGEGKGKGGGEEARGKGEEGGGGATWLVCACVGGSGAS